MLPITTVIYASLHNVQHVAIPGILPYLLRLLALTAISKGYVSFLHLPLSSWCQ